MEVAVERTTSDVLSGGSPGRGGLRQPADQLRLQQGRGTERWGSRRERKGEVGRGERKEHYVCSIQDPKGNKAKDEEED